MKNYFIGALPSQNPMIRRLSKILRAEMLEAFCLWLLVLTLSSSALAQETSVACDAEPTDMSIDYGDFVDCSLGSTVDSDIFRWPGTQGEQVLFRVRSLSGSVEPCFTIFDPDTSTLIDSSCMNNEFLQEVEVELPATGTYTVLIEDGLQNEAGNYRVLLERILPFSPTVERIVEFGLVLQRVADLLIDVDFYLFDSAGDETLNIEARSLSGSVEPCLTLYDPTDAIVATSSCGNNEFLQEISGFMPAIAGTYLLRVEDRDSNEAGIYDMTAQCLFGTCPVALIFTDGFESGDTSAWSSAVPPSCVAEGGTVQLVPPGPTCCEGLVQIPDAYPRDEVCFTEPDTARCTYCGDGDCGLGENPCNCPADC